MEEFRDLILSQVEPLDEELERGAYGKVYKVKHNGKTRMAKETYLFLACGIEIKFAQKTIELFLRVLAI